jgi:hypothetical protein
MNKREFLAGGLGAVVTAQALAEPAEGGLARWVGRTRRLPDLASRPGVASFEAYVGERFAVVGEADAALVLQAVTPVARCASTEQFSLAFAQVSGRAREAGTRVLEHATGQRIALHLEPSRAGYAAHFNLLA